MDPDAVNELANRLASRLTRRRSIGVFGALGLGSVFINDAAMARHKKHKKKNKNKGHATTTPAPTTTRSPQCAACTACETCVNNTCQPRAQGAACGSGGICDGGICARACGTGKPACASFTACAPAVNGAGSICVDLNGICGEPACNEDAECQSGEKCLNISQILPCERFFYCGTIVRA